MDQSTNCAPEAHWRKALAQGRLLLQRDPEGKAYFPPRLATPEGEQLAWFKASGRGTIYSMTIIHPRPPARPYNVVLVDLVEGPRMMSRVEDISEGSLAIGMAVSAQIVREDGEALVVFHPA